MPSEADFDNTLARSNEVDALWGELEQKLADYEQDKRDFAGEFGFEFEDYLSQVSQQAKDVQAVADADTLAELEAQRKKIEDEFETELRQATARHKAEKQPDQQSAPKKARRIRNMV